MCFLNKDGINVDIVTKAGVCVCVISSEIQCNSKTVVK